jgi:hypothetical protein
MTRATATRCRATIKLTTKKCGGQVVEGSERRSGGRGIA